MAGVKQFAGGPLVTLVAPGMWRVETPTNTYMAFWWTDSEVVGSTESFVWHLQRNGSWVDHGGFGGTVGEYPEHAVAHVISEVEKS